MQKIFDYAHARITITQKDGLVEIEVWPKVGVSAYVILTPADAEEVGEMIMKLADDIEPERPDNVVSLDSRRKRPMN